jgi:hypothetical protein
LSGMTDLFLRACSFTEKSSEFCLDIRTICNV